ncbi:MAG: preprotein translocase subunit SecE [Neisseriaceae bacterium]|nr:MAG: preprotein translocase subunit SecE [Neisseriaceae bacterium]
MMKQNKQAKNKIIQADVKRNYTTELAGKRDDKKIKRTSNQTSEKITTLDKFKLFLGLVVLGLGIWGYYHFNGSNLLSSNTNSLLSYLCPILGVFVFLSIVIYGCSFGRDIINYIKEATTELRKVVWPDRKTTTRMTMLVMFFVFILALFMWISDAFIQWVLYDIILRR